MSSNAFDLLGKVPNDILLEMLNKEDCEQSLAFFIRDFWDVIEPSTPLVWGWPLDAMIEHLEAVTSGDIKRLLMNVPPGFMKLCADSTPVPTLKGYMVHGDLMPGDCVFGPDGKPTRILSVTTKALADYRVTFSNGEKIECNGEHLWTVYDRFDGRKERTFSVNQLIERGSIVYVEKPTGKERYRYGIPDFMALEFPKKELPLDPYFLGCWLGDGTSSKPDITYDPRHSEHISKLEGLGFVQQKIFNGTGNSVRAAFTHQGVLDKLRALGVYKNKHIPEIYATASIEQRMELMAGLIDTDGTVVKDRSKVAYTTCDKALADGVHKLAYSLGFRAYITKHAMVDYGKYKSSKECHYRVSFEPNSDIPTVMPNKKITRIDAARRRVMITAIEKVDNPELGHCIHVDRPDGLYIVGNKHVVTHNSLLVSVFWPAWEWGPRGMPNLRYINTSYSSSLTERDNRRFRQIILSEKYQRRWGKICTPSKDQFNVVVVGNQQTGWKLATSIGGVGTGQRGDRIIIDDANSVSEAESQAVMESTNIYLREVIPNRLNNMSEGVIVNIQQRTGENDASATLMNLDVGYEGVIIPMEYDWARPPTSIGWTDPRTKEGELAWPDRFSTKVVANLRRTMGPYGWAGQYQQSPAPRGGGIFKRNWWQLWPPDGYDDSAKLQFPPMEYICASVDTAYTANTSNDYSACVVLGVWRDKGNLPRIMLMKAWQERMEFHDLVEKIIDTCRNKGGSPVDALLIEAKASGLSVAQEIQRLCNAEEFAVHKINPGAQDKVARAYAVQHLFSSGVVYAPERKYADMVINQAETFPKGKHDDTVDALVMGINFLRKMGLAVLAEEGAKAVVSELMYNPKGESIAESYDV